MKLVTIVILTVIFVPSRGVIPFDRNVDSFWKYPSIVYYDQELNLPSGFEIYCTSTYCQCKNLCFMKRCNTFSMMKFNESCVLCSISSLNVYEMKLRKSHNAFTYAYYNERISFLGDDGIFYKIVADSYFVDQARSICSNHFPLNGRVVMPKTMHQFQALYQAIKKSGNTKDTHFFLIDLLYDTTSDQILWGDSTRYNDSETSRFVPLEKDPQKPGYDVNAHGIALKIMTRSSQQNRWTFCQVKPTFDNE